MAKKKKGGMRRRKILPMIIDSSGVIHAGIKGIEDGDLLGAAPNMELGAKGFIGQLTSNYAGYDVNTGKMDLPALFIGYGPPIIRKMISKMGVRINWPF